jgi:serine O-acetyltransferase
MLNGLRRAWRQLTYLGYEIRLMNPGILNLLVSWSRPPFWVLVTYRFNRFFYLLFGGGWVVCRVILSPVLFLLQPWLGNCEVSYKADIGKGLKILHPRLGIVISQYAVIGEHLTLVGGNCIGVQVTGDFKPGDITLGDDVTLGANAVIVGPIRVGSRVTLGAGGVLVKDTGDNQTLVGVPARAISRT